MVRELPSSSLTLVTLVTPAQVFNKGPVTARQPNFSCNKVKEGGGEQTEMEGGKLE